MNPDEWKNDPRLSGMDPPARLSLQADARKNHITFTDQETALLISIITSGMPPDEKKKVEMLHFFAKKLAARSS